MYVKKEFLNTLLHIIHRTSHIAHHGLLIIMNGDPKLGTSVTGITDAGKFLSVLVFRKSILFPALYFSVVDERFGRTA
jgi:hypothetical protein